MCTMTSHLLPNLAAVQNVTVSDFANYITRTRRHVTCRAPCTELFTSTSAHLVTLHIDLFGTYDSMTRTPISSGPWVPTGSTLRPEELSQVAKAKAFACVRWRSIARVGSTHDVLRKVPPYGTSVKKQC